MKFQILFFAIFCITLFSCKKEEPVRTCVKYMEMLGSWDILETTRVFKDGVFENSDRNLSLTFREQNKGSLENSNFIWAIQCNPDVFLISTELTSTGNGNLNLFTTRRFIVTDFSSNIITMIRSENREIDGQNTEVETIWKLTR